MFLTFSGVIQFMKTILFPCIYTTNLSRYHRLSASSMECIASTSSPMCRTFLPSGGAVGQISDPGPSRSTQKYCHSCCQRLAVDLFKSIQQLVLLLSHLELLHSNIAKVGMPTGNRLGVAFQLDDKDDKIKDPSKKWVHEGVFSRSHLEHCRESALLLILCFLVLQTQP